MRENHYAISCIDLQFLTFSTNKISITLLIFRMSRSGHYRLCACEARDFSDFKYTKKL